MKPLTKTLILILMFSITLPAMQASQCTNPQTETMPCTAYTHPITCQTATIYNSDGNIANETNLLELNNSIYYYHVNLPEGDYVIQYCDNTTINLSIKTDTTTNENTYLILLIIGIILTITSFIKPLPILTFTAASIQIITGIYLFINTIPTLDPLYNTTIGIIHLGIGFYLTIMSYPEWFT